MPSKLWAVRSVLFDIFKTALDGEAVVFDGPLAVVTWPKHFLLVGTDGGDDGLGDSADGAASVQQASSMANNWRDEAGEVVSAVWVWQGDTKTRPQRVEAERLVGLCEQAVFNDRTLGGLLTLPGLAEWGGLRLSEFQPNGGAVIRAAFTISYRALITT